MRPGRLASCVYPDQLEAGSQIATGRIAGQKLDCFKQSSFIPSLREEHEARSDTGSHIALGRDLVSGSVDVLGRQLEEVAR